MSAATSTSAFPASYQAARAGFMEAAQVAGASVDTHAHPATGPDGEELAIDVARFGDSEAARVLVVGSGTHGVEGRCGSGLQRLLIAEGAFAELPPGLAVVLVHAINPFGFAFDRRVDGANVDVNRNFLDHEGPHPRNTAYDSLDEVLNPAELDLNDESWIAGLNRFGEEHGPLELFRATVGGQYAHPQGMQYGGSERTWSNETLHEIWKRHLNAVDLAVNIDIHTGLGPRGAGTVMQTANEGEFAAEIATEWWGALIRSARPDTVDPLTCGVLGTGFDADVPAKRTASIVLEFGTHEPMTVLGAMRADNWLAHYGDRQSEVGREISSRMRAAFFIDEQDWIDRVADRAHAVVTRAIEGLPDA